MLGKNMLLVSTGETSGTLSIHFGFKEDGYEYNVKINGILKATVSPFGPVDATIPNVHIGDEVALHEGRMTSLNVGNPGSHIIYVQGSGVSSTGSNTFTITSFPVSMSVMVLTGRS